MNPLLDLSSLPSFDRIQPAHARPALESIVAANREQLCALAKLPNPNFKTLVLPLEELAHRLSRVWSPIGHLHGVADSPEMRKAYNDCLPLITAYSTDLGQNAGIARGYAQVRTGESASLDPAQRKLVDNALRDFRLAGIELPEAQKLRFRAILQRLAQLGAKFNENVLDAASAYSLHTTDAARLAGLPQHTLDRGAADAAAAGKAGFLLRLDQPTYLSVQSNARDVELRREMYWAWTTRASDQGPSAGRFDNGPLIEEIMALRHEAAQLIGYPNFAEYALATRMASRGETVEKFLQDLLHKCRPAAARELAELEAFAGKPLEAWDLVFYTERAKEAKFAVYEEALRPYFPLPKVLSGLFELLERLYGIRVRERAAAAVWHPSVRYYDVLGAAGELIAGFYLDPYARLEKRSGAWMDECIVRKAIPSGSALPIAHLVCNFATPVTEEPSLLTHDEVTTLFHEFGHGLHHMLTQVPYPSVAGINGVAWDAVELPSQFMENFCWRAEVLPLISSHVKTGEPLPADMLKRLLATRTFNAALDTLRQLEFACFDFELHANFDPRRGARALQTLAAVRQRVAIITPPDWNRVASSFSHVFAGGYAAGYYSYKWAEVLAADAFSAFEDAGIFDRDTARRFLDTILSRGGSRDAMEAFIAFRGRKPDVTPLLRQTGIV
jgi:oligopeptidase A